MGTDSSQGTLSSSLYSNGCDNLSAISLAHNRVLHATTKHMELDVFFVQEKVNNKQLVGQHLQVKTSG